MIPSGKIIYDRSRIDMYIYICLLDLDLDFIMLDLWLLDVDLEKKLKLIPLCFFPGGDPNIFLITVCGTSELARV